MPGFRYRYGTVGDGVRYGTSLTGKQIVLINLAYSHPDCAVLGSDISASMQPARYKLSDKTVVSQSCLPYTIVHPRTTVF